MNGTRVDEKELSEVAAEYFGNSNISWEFTHDSRNLVAVVELKLTMHGDDAVIATVTTEERIAYIRVADLEMKHAGDDE